MKRIVLSALIAVLAIGSTTVSAYAAQAFEISVGEIGRSLVDDGVVPIYSITVGDVGKSELAAESDARRFDLFSTNGTIYTRVPRENERWFGVEWRKPKGAEEERLFERERQTHRANFSRYSFYRSLPAGSPEDVLPAPFSGLFAGDLVKVSAVVRYEDGSMRIFLFERQTTLDDIEALLVKIAARHAISRQ